MRKIMSYLKSDLYLPLSVRSHDSHLKKKLLGASAVLYCIALY